MRNMELAVPPFLPIVLFVADMMSKKKRREREAGSASQQEGQAHGEDSTVGYRNLMQPASSNYREYGGANDRVFRDVITAASMDRI